MKRSYRILGAAIGAAMVIVAGVVVGAGCVADHVVISEVLPNPVGNDDGQEWIELYNPTGAAVDISGWTGGSTEYPYQFTIPEGRSIDAYTCYLIGESVFLPLDYETDLTLANRGDYAHFILKTASGTIVDLVGWDSSIVYETAPCDRPGEGQSLQRKVNDTLDYDGVHGPAWDTDDNRADFFIGTPDPRCRYYPPVPPVPELTPLLLFATGLCMLAGYYLLSARQRAR